MKEVKSNLHIIGLLTAVWLILLALCALIWVLLVPLGDPIGSPTMKFLINAGKFGVSMLFVLLWLYGWYKSLGYMLHISFYLNENSDSARDS